MRAGPDTLHRLRRGDLAGARAVDLRGCGLRAVPAELFGLADTLERLDLGNNPIDRLPHDFSRLRRLRVLFASGAPFPVLPPVLGACGSLEQVGFRGCGVEAVPAEALPPRLRWLTLTANRIDRLPDAIGSRPGLRKLMLAGNRLASLPAALAGAEALELLRLSANRLEALPGFLGRMPRLAWLAAAGNPATGGDAAGSGRAIPWASLRLGAPLGEGASGRVHAASRTGPDGDAEAVAVKLFKASITSDGLPAHEMDAALAVGAHPALLGAHGRVSGHPDGADGLVLPLLPHAWRPLASPPSLESCTRDVYADGFAPAPAAALRIARAAAAAGAHLAGLDRSNGDLYAHNIHWDGDEGRAIVSDLGAATRGATPGQRATLERCDVLAWGILAGELLDRAPPGAAPVAALARLRGEATDPDPARRPRFAEIVRALSDRASADQNTACSPRSIVASPRSTESQ